MIDNIRYIAVDLDKTIKVLFCAYAFSIPFELAFEILLGIDTILKPFRVISLLLIFVFGLKLLRKGINIQGTERNDLFLYGFILYGIIISLIRIISGYFNIAYFYNDLFQLGLHLMVFFIFKNSLFTYKDLILIFKFLVAGVLLNCLYIFYSFNIFGLISRQSGFSDNPNYVAFGIAAVMTFVLHYSNYVKGIAKQLSMFMIVLFLLYVFMITGSRAGLIVLMFSILLVFFFSTIQRKIMVVISLLISGVFLLPSLVQNYTGNGSFILLNRIADKLGAETEDVRFSIWRGVFRMLETEGYWGLGIGQFKEKFSYYYTAESHSYIIDIVERGYFFSTHNDYLAILTDYGLIGLAFYVLYLFFIGLRNLNKAIKINHEERMLDFWRQYQFIIISCVAIFGMAAENFHHPLFWLLLMMSTKMVEPILGIKEDESEPIENLVIAEKV